MYKYFPWDSYIISHFITTPPTTNSVRRKSAVCCLVIVVHFSKKEHILLLWLANVVGQLSLVNVNVYTGKRSKQSILRLEPLLRVRQSTNIGS